MDCTICFEENCNKKKCKELISICDEVEDRDMRFTLRIPAHLMMKIDSARKKRIGTISRNLMILEMIQKCCEET